MFFFLIPLMVGFCSNLASAFTYYYSRKWGKNTGTFLTIILRDIFGMPLWAIGFVLAIREGESLLYNDTLLTTIIGWGLIFSGGIIIISALYTIRGKAAAQSAGDALVYKGLYSIVRHPVYSGTFLEFAGLLILWPSFTVGIAFITGTLWIAVQSKLEELDLQKRIEGYSDYMKITPPFFPYRLFMKGN